MDQTNEERVESEERLMALLTGNVLEFALKHDASRFIQCAIKYGNEEQRITLIKVFSLKFGADGVGDSTQDHKIVHFQARLFLDQECAEIHARLHP